MGLVYEAYDPKLDRRVAVKMLHASATADGEDLRWEAQAVALLGHPSVIQIYDIGRVQGRAYFVMELMSGGDLTRWIRNGPRGFAEVVRALGPVASGLSAVHGLGVLHRDLKPSNILVRDDGALVLSDFGLSAPTNPPSSSGTWNAEEASTAVGLLGTPAYMAPEQARGEPATARSDQYSFALCVAEALGGRRGGSDVDALPIPTRSRRALKRALHADPAERFSDVAAMWAAFGEPPSRRRNLWGAVLGVGLSALTLMVLSGDEQASCDDVGREAAARLERGVDAVEGLSEVPQPQLDELASRVQAWAQRYRDACALAPATRPQVVRCLRREHHQLDLVLRGVLEDAPGARFNLRDTLQQVDGFSCEGPGGAASADPELSRRIDEAELMVFRGDLDGALRELDVVVPLVSEPGRRALLPRALRWRAAVYGRKEALPEARQEYALAYHHARILGNDLEMLRISVSLAGLLLPSPDEAESWVSRALAARERVSAPSTLDANLAGVRARLAQRAGNYRASIELAQAGLVDLDESDELELRSELLLTVGWSHFELVEDEPASQAAQTVSDLLEAERGPLEVQFLDATRLLGATADRQGRPDDALRHFARMSARASTSQHLPPSVRVTLQVAYARALRRRGDNAEAIELLENALAQGRIEELSEADKHQFVPLWSTLGWVYLNSGRPERALPLFERAVVFSEERGEDPNLALILVAKATALQDLHRTSDALEVFARAVEILERTLGADSTKTLWARQLRANARTVLDPESSRLELQSIIERLVAAHGAHNPLVADAYRDLADAEVAVGKRAAAKQHLLQALALKRELVAPDHVSLGELQDRLDAIERDAG